MTVKNYLNNYESIVNTTDLTLKQMFDISTRLVSELIRAPLRCALLRMMLKSLHTSTSVLRLHFKIWKATTHQTAHPTIPMTCTALSTWAVPSENSRCAQSIFQSIAASVR